MNDVFNSLPPLSDISFEESHSIQSPVLDYHFENAGLTKAHLSQFQHIAESLQLSERLKDIQNAALCNPSENRAANHYQYRKLNSNAYKDELKRCFDFCERVDSLFESPIEQVIHLGIGGSHLGPKGAYVFFDCFFSQENRLKKREATFISNIDPIEFKLKMKTQSPNNCLFIISSKSGSTQETLSNYELLREWWINHGQPIENLNKRCAVITTKGSQIDTEHYAETRFYIDDHIGGRFSLSSVMGACVLSLCFGKESFEELLEGARLIDENSLNKKVTENITVLSALLSIFYRNKENYSSFGIIPYSYALSKFYQHLQQLICESNGKSLDLNGKAVDYATSPIIFGGQGTNVQHSFFQLLNQGSDCIPVEFISCDYIDTSSSNSKAASLKLDANLKAQEIVFREGNKESAVLGNRSTTLIKLKGLSPKHFGALLAYYENKVVLQGLIWNINSFDQPGVELAKRLAKEILEKQQTI